MALLCGMAYAIGSAVRFNIMALDREAHVGRTVWLESLASWALAFAYIISVAYYLNLLGSFAVSLTPWNTAMAGRIVTSAVYAVILSVGWTKGFHALERLEQVSVGLKLAIIGGLLFGLGWYFALTAQGDALVFAPATQTGWASKAFAAYYALQAAIAVGLAKRDGAGAGRVMFLRGFPRLLWRP